VFNLPNKDKIFSYGYEINENTWNLEYKNSTFLVLENSGNSKSLNEFRELVIDTKYSYLFLFISLTIILILLFIPLICKFKNYQISSKSKNVYLLIGGIFVCFLLLNAININEYVRGIEHLFYSFPESPPYPK